VALELFSERGYDRTSLRELAERLRITKAAVYHHFATKEDILASLAEDFAVPVDELLTWGRGQPAGPATRRELLRRYADLLAGRHGRLVRFLEDDRAGLRELAPARQLLGQLDELSALLRDGGPAPEATLRARLCLIALHGGAAVSAGPGGTRAGLAEEADRREAALVVAQDLAGPVGF